MTFADRDLLLPKCDRSVIFADISHTVFSMAKMADSLVSSPPFQLAQLDVTRRLLAAFKFDIIADLLSFIQTVESGLLNSRDMDKDVLAACLRLDEPIALLRVEPFDYADRHSFPLRITRPTECGRSHSGTIATYVNDFLIELRRPAPRRLRNPSIMPNRRARMTSRRSPCAVAT